MLMFAAIVLSLLRRVRGLGSLILVMGLLFGLMMLVLMLRLGIGHHDTHAWISSRHLSILLEQASILHLRIAVFEFMLWLLGPLTLSTVLVLVLSIS